MENGSATGDVALLVDWENLKFSLAQRERKPNVTALRSAAERFGRIVYASAYADWQDPVHSGDPASLYMAGLEPVYVLTRRYAEASGEIRIKNSVDVKLAADCIEASHQFPNIGTYIIVTGDHGFLHVVNTLRPHGKRVVIIGVSWTTSSQLTEQADVVLYYDLDVEPLLQEVQVDAASAVRPSAPVPPAKVSPKLVAAAETAVSLLQAKGTDSDARKIADILDLCVAITEEFRNASREISVSLLGQELQKRMAPTEFARYGKGNALAFAQALHQHRQLKLVQHNFKDFLFLPDEPDELASAVVPASFDQPRYDYAGFVWADVGGAQQDEVIAAIHDERQKPGIDFLTFNRVRDIVERVVHRDEYATKNLINNMLTIGVLRFDQQRQGRDPLTGAPYQFNSISLDLQHPDVRRALKLG
jgi:hypothetical protein